MSERERCPKPRCPNPTNPSYHVNCADDFHKVPEPAAQPEPSAVQRQTAVLDEAVRRFAPAPASAGHYDPRRELTSRSPAEQKLTVAPPEVQSAEQFMEWLREYIKTVPEYWKDWKQVARAYAAAQVSSALRPYQDANYTLNRAATEVARLREALSQYGSHAGMCDGMPCTCGFRAAVLGEPKPEVKS